MPRCESSALWRVSLFVFVALLLTLACSRAALADTWSAGQVITYTQYDWSAEGPAATLLSNGFFTVYPNAVVVVGEASGGFSLVFDNASSIEAYLPTTGNGFILDGNYFDPSSTSAGFFGGDVLALQMDVDFSDAGLAVGSSGIAFGNLVLTGLDSQGLPLLDGLTVRQVLADANTDLGGGESIYPAGDLAGVVGPLTAAFDDGIPNSFAQEHLLPPNGTSGGGTSMPEPSSVLLLGAGLLGLGILQHKRRGTHPTLRAVLKP